MPGRPILAVVASLKAQESFHQDVATWLEMHSQIHHPQSSAQGQGAPAQGVPGRMPLFYPGWEVLPQEGRLPHVDVISERLETLIALIKGLPVRDSGPQAERSAGHSPGGAEGGRDAAAPVIVASLDALVQRTFPREYLAEHTRKLTRGERVDPLDLVQWLEEQGYEPEAQVTEPGAIALHGGILDIFPLTSAWPIRLDFFGDELESLRFFDPLTQVSREETTSIMLAPAGELGLLKRSNRPNEPGPAGPDSPGQRPPGALSLPANGNLGTFLDYLPKETILLLCEPDQLETRASEYAASLAPGDPFHVAWDSLLDQAVRRGMTVVLATGPGLLDQSPATLAGDEARSSGSDPATGTPSTAPTLPLESLDAFRPLAERPPEPQVAEAQRREFFDQLHRWLGEGYAVHVLCNNEGERQRFGEIWREYGLAARSPRPAEDRWPSTPSEAEGAAPETVLPDGLRMQIGSLTRGFIYHEAKVVVATDAEIFGRYKVQRPRRLKSPRAQLARSALDIDFADLDDGDYVVHLQHGIGRYLGLQVLPVGAGTKPIGGSPTPATSGQECLVIEYAPTDPAQPPPKLYVPVTEAHLVSKYVGTGKARPPLNTLGGSRWAKAKAQAEQAVRDVASELLQIQAARESQAGHAFGPDAPWQREFESAFLFEETPDQMRAILETKADMQRPKPMDRLICGDVGFGKTEVGIRAAFKAVMDGRQVAVLVPTTVLAQQHFNTFRERMADYPVRIELLSRFRTRRAQQRVIKDLVSGRRGYCHRHPSPAAKRHRLQGSRPGRHRRGAALRGFAQGKVQNAPPPGRCADAQRHADPAHPLPGAHRRARHEHDPNPAPRSTARRDHRHPVRRTRDP